MTSVVAGGAAHSVVSEQAETASRLLMKTLGAHMTSVAEYRAAPPTRLRLASDSDRIEIQRQATLVRLLSIAESFSAQLLGSVVGEEFAMAQSRAVESIWDDAIDRATDSWTAQKGAYQSWLGVSNNSNWKTVENLAHARNAVAHGLGRLTRRQLRKRQTVEQALRVVGVPLRDDQIVLDELVLAAIALRCRQFVEQLDRDVRQKLPA